ncbi:hypothetical protein [Lysobacter tyrosinilyticus]
MTLHTHRFIATGIFRHAIHGVVEKRRASMRAALRVYEPTGVQAVIERNSHDFKRRS